MKYKLQLFGKRLQIYAGFPQVWIFIFLVFAAVLFYCLSIKVCDEYYKSLFTNIFSGLLTGLVLSALSGSRQVYIAKQEKKYEWLKQLHERIMDYKTMRGRFLSNDFGENDRDDFIYDMGAHASWINDFIKIGVSDKRIHFNPITYCKKAYGYNVDVLSEQNEKIHDALMRGDYSDKKSVLELFQYVEKGINNLNHKVASDMRDIEIKIATAQRSLI